MSTPPIENHTDILPNGTILNGRYKITGLLGAGGFALVYKGRQLKIDRPVAIKILNSPGNPTARSAYEDRFLREAKTAALIHHENVVTIHDFGLIEGTCRAFIVMEMLEGHDLKQEIYTLGPMSPQRLIPLFLDCLEAVGEGHEKGIVHKDLKPSNLFLDNAGASNEKLKVLDFGIARISTPGQGRLTGTGKVMGTPKYYAPEYARNQLVLPALDVYQMGLILVEALSGKPAVHLDDAYACLMRHCRNELEISEVLLTGPLGPIIHQALALDHQKRFANASVFREALMKIDPSEIEAPLLNAQTRLLSDITGSHQMLVLPLTPSLPANITHDTLGGPNNESRSFHPDAVMVHSDGRIEPSTAVPTFPLSVDSDEFEHTQTIIDPKETSPPRLSAPVVAIGTFVAIVSLLFASAAIFFIFNTEGEKAPVVAVTPEPAKATPEPEIPVEKLDSVAIESSPSGAEISFPDRALLLKTPCEFTFRPDDPDQIEVEAHLDGYQPKKLSLFRKQDGPLSIEFLRVPDTKTIKTVAKKPKDTQRPAQKKRETKADIKKGKMPARKIKRLPTD